MSDTMQRLAAALADRYRIERELGAGGIATVYLAQGLKDQRAGDNVLALRAMLGTSLDRPLLALPPVRRHLFCS